MPKDVKNENSSKKDQPATPRMLDRRARKSGDHSDERGVLKRPLSEDAFHETVTRYCRRFQKDGRDFCLASVTVLEYKGATDKERDHLDKAVVGVLLKELRAEDRICFIEPAHYLILLPSSQLDEANFAIRRVTEKISQSRVKGKSSQMQPSAFAKVVSASNKASQSEGGAVVDPETLYNCVGYTLNSKGRLLSLKGDEKAAVEPLFRGNYDGWMERYSPVVAKQSSRKKASTNSKSSNTNFEIASARMHDRWNGDDLVDFRELMLPHFASGSSAIASSALSANLLRRLRILQNLDHPGVNKLSDFFAGSDGKLLLVNRPPDGVDLTASILNGNMPIKVDAAVLVSWLQQILSALIAMQTLVPPVVPTSFDGIRVFCCNTENKNGGQIVLYNFDSEYLISSAQVNSESSGHTAATGQQSLLAGIVDFIFKCAAFCRQDTEVKDLIALLKKLDANSMSSPYRLRSELKKFVEYQNA